MPTARSGRWFHRGGPKPSLYTVLRHRLAARWYDGAVSVSSVPGFGVLGLNGDGSSSQSSTPPSTASTSPNASSGSSSSSTTTAAKNPYQQTYDQIETWSAQYLMQAVEYGAPPIPQFTAGQSVDSFAQLTNTLAAIQPGIQNGIYGGGTGTNVNTTA